MGATWVKNLETGINMRITKDHTVGLVIDIQERLLPHIAGHEALLKNVETLIRGLNALEVPVMVTEQYRKGLGETLPAIKEAIGHFDPMEKMTFSCCDDPQFSLKLNNMAKKNVIVCGIESHVCVLQTVIDLLESGFQPVVVEDCISSRRSPDKLVAVERMRQEGAIITTFESILFELARVSGTDTFKAISKLVK
jgi:nicotinamidase-related amidase